MNVYKKAVFNDTKLNILTEEEKERLFELCLNVWWDKKLNVEQFTEKMIKANEIIGRVNALSN